MSGPGTWERPQCFPRHRPSLTSPGRSGRCVELCLRGWRVFLDHGEHSAPLHRGGWLAGLVAVPVARRRCRDPARAPLDPVQAIAESGGTKAKNRGDGLMVVFGSASPRTPWSSSSTLRHLWGRTDPLEPRAADGRSSPPSRVPRTWTADPERTASRRREGRGDVGTYRDRCRHLGQRLRRSPS